MVYIIILGLMTGGLAAFAMGDSPSWLRVILATLAGLALGAFVDIGLTVLSGPVLARGMVVVPVFRPYGFTDSGLIAISFSLVGAVLAARRNWVRISDPNDLRR